MSEQRDWVPGTLRVVALAVLVVCAVGIPLSLLPGVHVYRDASDCFGRIFAAHGSSHCTTTWVHHKTLYPGVPVISCLLGIGILAFALRRWPSGVAACVGSLPVFALAVIGAVRAVDFQIFSFDHREVTWSAQGLTILFLIVMLTATAVFLTAPTVGLARYIKRKRAARPAPLPSARVVERD